MPFPSDLSAFSDGVVWYITAHFNYTDYKSRHFKVGDNTKSADMHRNRAYSNVPLDSNLKYFVYTLVVAYNETNVGYESNQIKVLAVLTFVVAGNCLYIQ